MASYRRHDGTWLRSEGPKAGRPVGPLLRRRLERRQRRAALIAAIVPPGWSDGDGDVGDAGGAGVREPRRPAPTAPAAAASLELPVD